MSSEIFLNRPLTEKERVTSLPPSEELNLRQLITNSDMDLVEGGLMTLEEAIFKTKARIEAGRLRRQQAEALKTRQSSTPGQAPTGQ